MTSEEFPAEVEPPAAKICERCEYVEKVTQIREVSTAWKCPECGWGEYRVDNFSNVSEKTEQTDP